MRHFALVPLIALAACSQGGGSGNATAPAGGSTAGATSSGALADACAALPREEVQQAIGRPITSVEPDSSPDSGNGMASSGCTYDFGEARLVQLTLQQYPEGVDAGTVQSGQREMESQGGQTQLEDVPGLGVHAFYSPPRTSLYVQLDGRRQLIVKLTRLPDVADPKGKLIAMARRVIG